MTNTVRALSIYLSIYRQVMSRMRVSDEYADAQEIDDVTEAGW